jgi:hypothetical protein
MNTDTWRRHILNMVSMDACGFNNGNKSNEDSDNQTEPIIEPKIDITAGYGGI